MNSRPAGGATLRSAWVAVALMTLLAPSAAAQEPADAVAAVTAVADAALAAISAEDWVALTDLMIPEVVIVSTSADGGEHTYRARGWEEERNGPDDIDVVERGFDAQVQVAGNVGMVWLPYDLYIDGEWSHCGVDVLTLVRTAEGWRIASFAYSVEQPPACRPHPDGPLH